MYTTRRHIMTHRPPCEIPALEAGRAAAYSLLVVPYSLSSRSLVPSFPCSLAPSLPCSLAPLLPRSLAPSLPCSLAPSLSRV